MKRFRLSRKEKLLFATPMLLPLLVLAWPLVATNSFEKTLHSLAGLEAVDCGVSSSPGVEYDPCAISAFKAGKPFIVRRNKDKTGEIYMNMTSLVRTPQGQVYSVSCFRREKIASISSLTQVLMPNARIVTERDGEQFIFDGRDKKLVKKARVWK